VFDHALALTQAMRKADLPAIARESVLLKGVFMSNEATVLDKATLTLTRDKVVKKLEAILREAIKSDVAATVVTRANIPASMKAQVSSAYVTARSLVEAATRATKAISESSELAKQGMGIEQILERKMGSADARAAMQALKTLSALDKAAKTGDTKSIAWTKVIRQVMGDQKSLQAVQSKLAAKLKDPSVVITPDAKLLRGALSASSLQTLGEFQQSSRASTARGKIVVVAPDGKMRQGSLSSAVLRTLSTVR
jgi:hypothetical protein